MPEMDGYQATQAIRFGEAGDNNIATVSYTHLTLPTIYSV